MMIKKLKKFLNKDVHSQMKKIKKKKRNLGEEKDPKELRNTE